MTYSAAFAAAPMFAVEIVTGTEDLHTTAERYETAALAAEAGRWMAHKGWYSGIRCSVRAFAVVPCRADGSIITREDCRAGRGL